jgi:sugar-phosphatase
MDEIAKRQVIVECRAILFDMDGTLVDSTPVVERQWKMFAEKYRLDYDYIMKISHGRRNAETIREVAPHLATPEVFAAFDEAEIQDRQGVLAVKGAEALLAQLGQHEWAVVTSASRALARARLGSVALPVPAVLIGADDVSEGKPHPEGYLKAARRLELEEQHCIVFEDTQPGLRAADAAGMRGFGITTTYPHGHLAPADCIADFEAAMVERLDHGGLRLTLVCY